MSEPHRELRTVSPRRDLCIAVVLFAVGAFAGMVYSASWGGKAQFWQNTTFMQSLMWACGRGFENPRVSQVPGLEAFLNGDTDSFDCGCIPGDADVLPRDTRGMTYDEIDAYHPQPDFHGFLAWQRYHRYLVWTVAWLWRVLGVSWSALTPLCGVLCGLTAVALYGLFRLAAGRWLATLFALLVTVSPLHLEQVPHIRDYSKAPFILIALLFMGLLVKRSRSARATLAIAILCGASIGIGVGFRTDVLICAPAFPVVALIFLPGSLRATWRLRFGAVVAFLAVAGVAGLPVLLELFREAGHFAHVAILGLLHYCDARLGVGSPLYELGDPFSDYYVLSVVQSFSERTTGWMPPTRVMSAEYHEATQQFLHTYVATFPGDMLLRAYASVLRVVDELRVNFHEPQPAGITNAFLGMVYTWYAALTRYLLVGGRYTVALALLALAARNVRLACAALFLLLYFAGYPAIQFTLRHAFHLEFISYWMVALLLAGLWRIVRRPECWTIRAESMRGVLRGAVRAGAFAAVAALVLWLPLAGLRAYQEAKVRTMLETYAEVAGRDPIPPCWPQTEPVSDENVLLRFPCFSWSEGIEGADALAHSEYRYLRLEIAPGPEAIPVTFVFEAKDPEHWDFTRTLTVPPASGRSGTAIMYFPVYWRRGGSEFAGVRIDASHQKALRRVHEILGGGELDHVPIWLTCVLPPGWEDMPLYERLTR